MSESIVSASKDVMGGTPVFVGTRVPVQTLLDYLESGETIDDFLAGFPTVSREQVIAFGTRRQLGDHGSGVKVLLDECVDSRLAQYLDAFETRTVADMGWR